LTPKFFHQWISHRFSKDYSFLNPQTKLNQIEHASIWFNLKLTSKECVYWVNQCPLYSMHILHEILCINCNWFQHCCERYWRRFYWIISLKYIFFTFEGFCIRILISGFWENIIVEIYIQFLLWDTCIFNSLIFYARFCFLFSFKRSNLG